MYIFLDQISIEQYIPKDGTLCKKEQEKETWRHNLFQTISIPDLSHVTIPNTSPSLLLYESFSSEKKKKKGDNSEQEYFSKSSTSACRPDGSISRQFKSQITKQIITFMPSQYYTKDWNDLKYRRDIVEKQKQQRQRQRDLKAKH